MQLQVLRVRRRNYRRRISRKKRAEQEYGRLCYLYEETARFCARNAIHSLSATYFHGCYGQIMAAQASNILAQWQVMYHRETPNQWQLPWWLFHLMLSYVWDSKVIL